MAAPKQEVLGSRAYSHLVVGGMHFDCTVQKQIVMNEESYQRGFGLLTCVSQSRHFDMSWQEKHRCN